MDLGKAGGGRAAGTQRRVIGWVDPSSKWVHAEVFQGAEAGANPSSVNVQRLVCSGLTFSDGLSGGLAFVTAAADLRTPLPC